MKKPFDIGNAVVSAPAGRYKPNDELLAYLESL